MPPIFVFQEALMIVFLHGPGQREDSWRNITAWPHPRPLMCARIAHHFL